jgi:hypothetical protein
MKTRVLEMILFIRVVDQSYWHASSNPSKSKRMAFSIRGWAGEVRDSIQSWIILAIPKAFLDLPLPEIGFVSLASYRRILNS